MPNMNEVQLEIPYLKKDMKFKNKQQNGYEVLVIEQNGHNELIEYEAPIVVSDARVSIEDVILVSKGRDVRLSRDPNFLDKIEKSRSLLERLLSEGERIYGVTTNYGDSCTISVPKETCLELTKALLRSFACALGDHFDHETSRAILFTRLISLSKGYSGIRLDLLEQLSKYIEYDIAPVIPQEGSVGASGDLMPMSYVAAALVGERKVFYKGKICETSEALLDAGLTPLTFAPKECLGIMNGTTVMTALACQAWKRADYLSKMASRITSLVSLAILGNRDHYHPRLMSVKPHQGQIEVGHWIYKDLSGNPKREKDSRLQDRYSLRCAPHVIGVLRDALTWMRRDVENELNSVNDNPVLDPESGLALSGGHFYGGHIAFAMDSLKNATASVADLLDRQLALLVDTKFSNGLPANLTGAEGERVSVSLGFKALQISVSSYTAEALKLTMPATSFSRSTECHNQDKVSMGTIAARHAVRVMTLTEQVAACCLMAAVQAVDLRLKQGELTDTLIGADMMDFFDEFRQRFARLEDDRPMEDDLRRLIKAIKNESFDFYSNV